MIYEIGTKFIRSGLKRKDVETIIDIYATYSTASKELIKIEYLATHDFLGQSIKSIVCESTIARSTIVY